MAKRKDARRSASISGDGQNMFRGQYEHTMDSKGRVSLPARYREVLAEMDVDGQNADRVILTRNFENSLELYPYDKWLNFEQRVRELPQFDPNVQRIKKVLVAGAVEVSLDSHGRILVPQPMRQFGGLEREVTWVGQLDTVQLWAKSRWEQAVDKALDNPEDLQAAAAEFGL
ncbi:MAG: division/cell wall cluster transcriptional repressor MraZ [Myxococcota bacterium]